MNANHRTLDVLTAAQLARELDLSASRVIRAINSGIIEADARAGHTFIFHRRRVGSLARKLGSEINLPAIGAGKPLE
jgi:hypothetical protein